MQGRFAWLQRKEGLELEKRGDSHKMIAARPEEFHMMSNMEVEVKRRKRQETAEVFSSKWNWRWLNLPYLLGFQFPVALHFVEDPAG